MIQFDYPSSGISRKERRKYTFSNFRGVDTSVAKINVDPSRAVESTNFVDRNGVLHKRYGWEQVYQFDGPINGFWELFLDGVTYTICYAGTTFYLLSSTGWDELYTNKDLASRRTSCYVQNDKAYFVGCGDFLVFRVDATAERPEYKIFPVVNDTETYIPTTTKQICSQSAMKAGIKGQYVRDGVNLLTGWRKNTLVGEAVPEDGELKYKLDGAPSIYKDHYPQITAQGDTFLFEPGASSTPVEVNEGDNISKYYFQIKPHHLGMTEKTTLYNTSEDGESYPDISYDAIEKENAYGDWLLKVKRRVGIGSYGLQWYRTDDKYVGEDESYRIYVLRLRPTNTPCLCRVYRNPYMQKIPVGFNCQGFGFVVESNDENQNCDVTFDIVNTTGKTFEKVEISITVRLKTIVLDFGVEVETVTERTQTFTEAWSLNERKNLTVEFGEIPYHVPIINQEKYRNYTYDITVKTPVVEEIVESKGFYDMDESLSIFSAQDIFSTFNIIAAIDSSTYKTVASFLEGGLSCVDDATGLNCNIDVDGVLTVNSWGITEDSEDKEVTLKFYCEPEKTALVSTSQHSTFYGVNGESNRLFLASGDKKQGNIILFSEKDDFTYFPDNFTKSVGGNANEVKGFIRLANGSMAALKSFRQNEPTVFVFSGDYIEGYYDADKTEPYTLPRFSTSGVSTTQGILAPYASSNLADDSLFLSQNGVYALELSSGTDSQRFAKERSLPINKLLKECNIEELEDAVAITHENKYYLAVKHYKRTSDKAVDRSKTYYVLKDGVYTVAEYPSADLGMHNYYEREDCVYVADAHYSFKPDGAMADAPSYEWYPLNNMPVYNWFIVGQELYFGTEDGRICRFVKDSYKDVEKLYIATSTTDSNITKYSQSLVHVIQENIDSDNDGLVDTFSVGEDLGVVNGDTILFLSGNLQFAVDGGYDENADANIMEWVGVAGKRFTVYRYYDADGAFKGLQLKYGDGEKVVQFSGGGTFTAVIERQSIVKAYRETPTFDFGMPDYLKSLESFTIVMNGVEGGEMNLRIATRNRLDQEEQAEGQEAFNLLKGVGYNSYNVAFQNSYTKAVAIRNFNYASMKISNETETDCSVASISLQYKYNTRSRGVR